MKATAKKPNLGNVIIAVDETAAKINDRFRSDAGYSVRLANTNALMLSRAMDLLVQAGVLSEDERNDEMRNLYRKTGLL